MRDKRLTLFAGHYGSGKTNLAVNYALALAKEGKKVSIADLDIVNPYFRTKDSAKELAAVGVELISPRFANSNVDLPALPPESYRPVRDKSLFGVLDIGGDDRGAYALGRFAPEILAEGNFEMVFVVNFCRPLTTTAEEAMEVMAEIEAACGIPFTAIANNTNLGSETTKETLLESLPMAETLCQKTGLPLFAHGVRVDLEEQVAGQLAPLLPMTLQEKYFDLPEQKNPNRPLWA